MDITATLIIEGGIHSQVYAETVSNNAATFMSEHVCYLLTLGMAVPWGTGATPGKFFVPKFFQ